MIDATSSMQNIINEVTNTIGATVALTLFLPRTEVMIVVYKDYDSKNNGLCVHLCKTIEDAKKFLGNVAENTSGGMRVGYEASVSALNVALDIFNEAMYSGMLIYNITDEDGRFFNTKKQLFGKFSDEVFKEAKQLQNFYQSVLMDFAYTNCEAFSTLCQNANLKIHGRYMASFHMMSLIERMYQYNVKFMTLLCLPVRRSIFFREDLPGVYCLRKVVNLYEAQHTSTLERVNICEFLNVNISSVGMSVIMTDITRSVSPSCYGMGVLDLQSMFGHELRSAESFTVAFKEFVGGKVFIESYYENQWFNKDIKVWQMRHEARTREVSFFYFTIYTNKPTSSSLEYVSLFTEAEALEMISYDNDEEKVKWVMHKKAKAIVDLLDANKELCSMLTEIPIFTGVITSFIEKSGVDPQTKSSLVSQKYKELLKNASKNIKQYTLRADGTIKIEEVDSFKTLKNSTAHVYGDNVVQTTIASTQDYYEHMLVVDGKTAVRESVNNGGVFVFDDYRTSSSDTTLPAIPDNYQLFRMDSINVITWIAMFMQKIKYVKKTDPDLRHGFCEDQKKLFCVPAYVFNHLSNTNIRYSPFQVIFTLLDKEVVLKSCYDVNALLCAAIVLNNPTNMCDELLALASYVIENFNFKMAIIGSGSIMSSSLFSNLARNILVQESTINLIKNQLMVDQLLASFQLSRLILVVKQTQPNCLTYKRTIFRAEITIYNTPETQCKCCESCKKQLFLEHFIRPDDTVCGYCMSYSIDSRIGKDVCQILNVGVFKCESEKEPEERFCDLLQKLNVKVQEDQKITVVKLKCGCCKRLYSVINFDKAPRHGRNHACPECRLVRALNENENQALLAMYASYYCHENHEPSDEITWHLCMLLHHRRGFMVQLDSRSRVEYTSEIHQFLISQIKKISLDCDNEFGESVHHETVNEYEDVTVSQIMTPDQFETLIHLQTGLKKMDLLNGDWNNAPQLQSCYQLISKFNKPFALKNPDGSDRHYDDADERKDIVEEGLCVTTSHAKDFMKQILDEQHIPLTDFLVLRSCIVCQDMNQLQYINIHVENRKCSTLLCHQCLSCLVLHSVHQLYIECPTCKERVLKTNPKIPKVTLIPSILNVTEPMSDDDDENDEDEDDDK